MRRKMSKIWSKYVILFSIFFQLNAYLQLFISLICKILTDPTKYFTKFPLCIKLKQFPLSLINQESIHIYHMSQEQRKVMRWHSGPSNFQFLCPVTAYCYCYEEHYESRRPEKCFPFTLKLSPLPGPAIRKPSNIGWIE